jgi:chromosomal replication initiation ATPase DnaA
MNVKQYTEELIDLFMKVTDAEPILKHKILRKVGVFKPYKDHKHKLLTSKRVMKPKRPVAPMVFINLPSKIQRLIILACEKHELSVQDFCSNRRHEEIVEAQRQVIYFLHKEARCSSKKVGLWFMKDHSTVLHACNVHNDYYETNKIYRSMYNYFREEANSIISES